MTQREKMLAGQIYDPSDPALCRQRDLARDLAAEFNQTKENEKDRRMEILRQLLGSIGEYSELYPRIQFDYGCNTYIGNRCYINFSATFLDCAEVRLGDDVFVGPNVSFLTPLHPLLARDRVMRFASDGHPYTLESCRPITVENNVWIGGNVTVLPGVTIGHDAVIGAGSVVTRDIPPGVLAVGNPCRVLREINEEKDMVL